MLHDLRYAIRMLLKSPGFTAIAVAALALGIGANTAIFTVIDRILLRPLPFKEADRLVFLLRKFPDGNFSPSISIPKYEVWKTAASIEDASVYDFVGAGMNLSSDGLPEQVKTIHVSENYFHLFRVSPVLGRTFAHEEDVPNGPKVTVISNGLWKRRFGGDPGMLGRSMLLNGEPYTVIGVMGGDYESDPKADVFIPLQADPNTTNQGHYLLVGARMKPGVTLAQLNAELKLVGDKFRRLYPKWMDKTESVGAMTMRDFETGQVKSTLWILLGAVGLVLLIACANVANLLLVRAAARNKEIAVRVAIGAGRKHIFQQLLTESLLLAGLGGAIGIFLGTVGLRLLLSFAPGNLPRMPEAETMSAFALLDGRILLFTIGLSLLTGVVFGLVPALQISRPDLNQALREGGARTTGGSKRQFTRSTLVVTEIALSLVLLIGAALLIRTFMSVSSVQTGFDASNVLTMKTSLAGKKYDNARKMETLIRNMQDHFEALPGVEHAAYAFNLPVEPGVDLPFSIVGRPAPDGGPYNGDHDYRLVSPHYFEAMRIPLRRGRLFNNSDSNSGAPVVIINEAFAKKYWPKDDPIGQSIMIGHGLGPEFEDKVRVIIGVVGNVHEDGLDQELPPIYYVPEAQSPDGMVALGNRILPSSWILRTRGNPGSLAGTVQREVLKVDSQLPVAQVYPMKEIVAKSTARQNFNMLLLGIFAGVALLLAAVGIYGVMAYTVEQRTAEIGIRVALGAQQSQMLALVMRHGLVLAGIGVAIGLGAAFGLTRLLARLLFGVKASDPWTFIGVAAVLALVALLACLIPARRATRVDPVIALRSE
ncbi:MAG TPA: ABC transporter permease [Bryobacteraceae bacterium]|nr:ABC transporter permease [Bryobacteraceae bacterium]